MLSFQTLLTLLFLTFPPETTVTFSLDLRGPIEEGWLDPATETVGLRGGTAPLSWAETWTATDEDGDGWYEASITFPEIPAVDSLVVEYKIKVDGTANPNDGWEAGENHRVVLRGESVEVRRAFTVPPPPSFTGDVRIHERVLSDFLDQPRDVYVYLPPGYEDQPDRRYPVLYLHDGRNVFDGSARGMEWGMDETAERLIEEGVIEPLIIVGADNTPARTYEYTPTEREWHYTFQREGDAPATSESNPLDRFTGRFQAGPSIVAVFSRQGDTLFAQPPDGSEVMPLVQREELVFFSPDLDVTFTFHEDDNGGISRIDATKPPEGGGGDLYGRFLVEELKPMIDRMYRTKPDSSNTGLGGASFGGLISMRLGLAYPDVFGKLIVASPSVWWDDRVLLTTLAESQAEPNALIWVDMGTAEGGDMLEGARLLRKTLVEKGWREGETLHYVEAEDAEHNETAWAARAEPMLRFLFPAE